ncbi:MAG TPA: hypothetical protein VFX20_18010 [Steroidobacteraceae bacterium]|nr:hypothetical protein [Steroidobacteraceae bacterium]
MSLSEFFQLRETDPARYEAMLEEIARRAFEAQEKLRALGKSAAPGSER